MLGGFKRPTYAAPALPHVQPAPGGSYHVYPDGRKVFVRHSALPKQATPSYNDPSFTASAAAAPAAPSTPAPQADPSGATLAPDSTYLLGQAQSTGNLNDALSANAAQGQTDHATFAEALRRMQAQQPLDEQAQRESANRQGRFYGGVLGSELGRIATSYAQKRADAQSGLQSRDNARLAARAALQHNFDVEQAAAAAAAADRQVAGDQKAAANDSLAPDPAGWGTGLSANGVFDGVSYVNGVPQGAPTVKSVLDAQSLLGTNITKRPAKRRA